MNKKWIVSGTIAVVLVLALSLSVVGFASAQTPQPPNRPFSPGYGMGGYGRGAMAGGQGMVAQNNANFDVMHNPMYDALAKGLGISRSDLDARVAKGETLAQIASAKGISAADFTKIWTDARKAGIDAAVAKGYFTKEQAAWMIDRSINRGGYGPGNHPYFGTVPTK